MSASEIPHSTSNTTHNVQKILHQISKLDM